MTNPEYKLVLIILSYLLGSISTSTILSKIKSIDITKFGSGNAGATNTIRALGKKYALIVLIFDFLKGLLPVIIAKHIDTNSNILPVLCAFSAVIGHVFPIFFAFKGGKGAATFIGAISAIFPLGALICLFIFVTTLILSGFVSLSTICAAISFPISIYLFNMPELMFFGVCAMLFIILSHLKNIMRLLKCNENRFAKLHIFNNNSIWYKK
ncbi:MAG: acyl-phosphate glycerol 3-phosphate acyltransferase [Candidatus Marinimicrobia bacterium]|nr:acyl-phosphate glycerol 3-phosphate acyltransferase [Candidatus Neomarinimicrobiota bacterium]|tara:strand:+ start:18011 stop:18643 length:633 start_codon:yes stop_codon:yes gene_type:complete